MYQRLACFSQVCSTLFFGMQHGRFTNFSQAVKPSLPPGYHPIQAQTSLQLLLPQGSNFQPVARGWAAGRFRGCLNSQVLTFAKGTASVSWACRPSPALYSKANLQTRHSHATAAPFASFSVKMGTSDGHSNSGPAPATATPASTAAPGAKDAVAAGISDGLVCCSESVAGKQQQQQEQGHKHQQPKTGVQKSAGQKHTSQEGGVGKSQVLDMSGTWIKVSVANRIWKRQSRSLHQNTRLLSAEVLVSIPSEVIVYVFLRVHSA